MLEPPTNLAEADLIETVRKHYGVSVASLTFLPLGADYATTSFRVLTTGGAIYFLKTRSRQGFTPASLAVPRYLVEHGVPHILAPLETASQSLFVMMNEFAVTLYRFIDGQIGGDDGLSEQQWVELGKTVKQIHAIELPSELMEIVPRESFVPRCSVVADLEEAISIAVDPMQCEFAAFWNSRHEQIRRLINRVDALGLRLREKGASHVLCHADLHTRNVLLEGNDH